ncbi:hypothetical protein [Marinifilum sp. D714]|uniref:hypothetical protein n=1 Tax=Marinifilum sp. D714 TaxID=2937523 RepID=UPI0027C1E301|nr:hypothetical protein [Marinifilum sp. D714]MDQ2180188.1 hypothetical protein [Marinifilum sp. D714]
MSNFRKEEEYEEMAATFQVFIIHWLNDSLIRQGIKDKETRRKIVKDFGFPFSIWKDQYWFKDDDDNKVFPLIAFSTKGPAADMDIEDLGDVYLPTKGFSFKGYWNGNISYYYDEINENIEEIPTGLD